MHDFSNAVLLTLRQQAQTRQIRHSADLFHLRGRQHGSLFQRQLGQVRQPNYAWQMRVAARDVGCNVIKRL